MLVLIEIPELSPQQVQSLTTALPDDNKHSHVSLDWHIPGDYFSLPVQAVELS
jgi:hypothetical protein